ncbi:MAG: hypothetical protein B9S32_12370 [Verrucomicrobia bacterium Tous-C9LFEB]|nr:MAG: hypothetical protein B9S32_12370 [Verrucomicrobia bacterium Tous-C9LFEB]
MLRSFAIIFLLPVLTLSAESTDTLVQKIIARDTANADLSVITDENRQKIVEIARNVVLRKVEGNYVGAQILLLRLGDAQTIKELQTLFSEYKGKEAWQEVPFYVERARQPLLVEAFSSSLYSPLDQGVKGIVGGVKTEVVTLVPPKPVMAGALIISTIRQSKEFSPELKAWAKEMAHNLDEADFISKMRLWWEQNKERFVTLKFKEVEPLRRAAASPLPRE